MTQLQQHSIQAFQQATSPPTGDTSILFSNIATPRKVLEEVFAAQDKLSKIFEASRGQADANDLSHVLRGLRSAQDKLKALEAAVQNDLLPHLMKETEDLIETLGIDGAPRLGMDFLNRMREVNCITEIEPTLRNPAQYISYSYNPANRGFVNTIALNPSKLDDVYDMANSIVHEMLHGYQKHAAPALHFSPFNPDTRILIHPEDWIMLENLCERDAYTKQALFNALLGKNEPSVKEKSKIDVVSVQDFEEAHRKFETLSQTIVHLALNALYKPTIANNFTRTFEHNYIDIALKNYAAGMALRSQENERNHIYVRLLPEDFWKVGDYGVGPNSLGQYRLDPGFQIRPKLLRDQQEKLHGIMLLYDIPALNTCATLEQAIQRFKPQTSVAGHEPSLY